MITSQAIRTASMVGRSAAHQRLTAEQASALFESLGFAFYDQEQAIKRGEVVSTAIFHFDRCNSDLMRAGCAAAAKDCQRKSG